MPESLLQESLDTDDPVSAFAAAGGLGFISDKKRSVSPGLLEALCVQIPEKTGKELVTVADCSDRWGLGDAFRQSIIWRSYAAFSDDTRRVLNKLCRTEQDLHDTLDALLTVATLPDHPLNGEFLDRRLRRGRDARAATRGGVCTFTQHTGSVVPSIGSWTGRPH